MSSQKMRLQKYLAQAGVASRRKSEELIEEGRVRVNGTVQSELGTKIDPAVDVIKVGNRVIRPEKQGLALFHKPRGVLSSRTDAKGRKIFTDYLPKKLQNYFPVGRLDYDSSGLLILTNDGELSQRLLHPRHGVERVYEVKISGELSEKELQRIQRGVRLQDGKVQADIKPIKRLKDAAWYQITLTVGRNRIIRRLMEHLRRPVQKLKRVRHGPFSLGRLKPGDITILSAEEFQKVRERVFGQG